MAEVSSAVAIACTPAAMRSARAMPQANAAETTLSSAAKVITFVPIERTMSKGWLTQGPLSMKRG